MDENFKKRIHEKLKEISPKYTETIENFGWEKIVEEISKKNSLLNTQTEDLFLETMLVIIGIVDEENFAYEIEDRLFIEEESAKKIAGEINTELLEPLNNILIKKFPELKNDLEDEQTIQNSISNPPASKPISFIEQKMSASHSLGQNSAPIPIPPGEKYADPYREEF